MATVSVRYIVRDVDAAVAFYCEHLGPSMLLRPTVVGHTAVVSEYEG